MNFHLNIINIIPSHIEKYIIKKMNKKPPHSFGPISDSEINYIKNKIMLKYQFDIDPNIIICIKSVYMKNQLIINHYKIKTYSKNIISAYNKKTNILELSKKYNLSPMTILRHILETKYQTKIKELIGNRSQILNQFDQDQLSIATKSDIYNQLDQTEQSIKSIEFEKNIEKILNKHNIEYQTQEELSEIQIKEYGKAINTPDFLIKSDLVINGIKINWIDAKNFYGSNIDFVKRKISKQIAKYINTYGSGCLIFKYGFNSKLKFDKVLIMSIESIS